MYLDLINLYRDGDKNHWDKDYEYWIKTVKTEGK